MKTLFDFSAMSFFSLFGLISVLLSLVPNFFFAKKEHIGRLDDIDTCGAGICMLEILSKWVLVLSLIFVRMPRMPVGYAIGAGAVLIISYYLWMDYFKEGCYYPDLYLKKFCGIPVPITVCNVAYFILISFWLGNIFAVGLSIVYGICYMMNSLKAMKDLRCRVYS